MQAYPCSRWARWTCIFPGRPCPRPRSYHSYLESDGLVGAVGVYLGDEGGSQGGLAKLVELIVHEPEEDAALADSGVPHHDDLDLGQVLLHTIIITDSQQK